MANSADARTREKRAGNARKDFIVKRGRMACELQDFFAPKIVQDRRENNRGKGSKNSGLEANYFVLAEEETCTLRP